VTLIKRREGHGTKKKIWTEQLKRDATSIATVKNLWRKQRYEEASVRFGASHLTLTRATE